jgi:hypothetical protein
MEFVSKRKCVFYEGAPGTAGLTGATGLAGNLGPRGATGQQGIAGPDGVGKRMTMSTRLLTVGCVSLLDVLLLNICGY